MAEVLNNVENSRKTISLGELKKRREEGTATSTQIESGTQPAELGNWVDKIWEVLPGGEAKKAGAGLAVASGGTAEARQPITIGTEAMLELTREDYRKRLGMTDRGFDKLVGEGLVDILAKARLAWNRVGLVDRISRGEGHWTGLSNEEYLEMIVSEDGSDFIEERTKPLYAEVMSNTPTDDPIVIKLREAYKTSPAVKNAIDSLSPGIVAQDEENIRQLREYSQERIDINDARSTTLERFGNFFMEGYGQLVDPVDATIALASLPATVAGTAGKVLFSTQFLKQAGKHIAIEGVPAAGVLAAQAEADYVRLLQYNQGEEVAKAKRDERLIEALIMQGFIVGATGLGTVANKLIKDPIPPSALTPKEDIGTPSAPAPPTNRVNSKIGETSEEMEADANIPDTPPPAGTVVNKQSIDEAKKEVDNDFGNAENTYNDQLDGITSPLELEAYERALKETQIDKNLEKQHLGTLTSKKSETLDEIKRLETEKENVLRTAKPKKTNLVGDLGRANRDNNTPEVTRLEGEIQKLDKRVADLTEHYDNLIKAARDEYRTFEGKTTSLTRELNKINAAIKRVALLKKDYDINKPIKLKLGEKDSEVEKAILIRELAYNNETRVVDDPKSVDDFTKFEIQLNDRIRGFDKEISDAELKRNELGQKAGDLHAEYNRKYNEREKAKAEGKDVTDLNEELPKIKDRYEANLEASNKIAEKILAVRMVNIKDHKALLAKVRNEKRQYQLDNPKKAKTAKKTKMEEKFEQPEVVTSTAETRDKARQVAAVNETNDEAIGKGYTSPQGAMISSQSFNDMTNNPPTTATKAEGETKGETKPDKEKEHDDWFTENNKSSGLPIEKLEEMFEGDNVEYTFSNGAIAYTTKPDGGTGEGVGYYPLDNNFVSVKRVKQRTITVTKSDKTYSLPVFAIRVERHIKSGRFAGSANLFPDTSNPVIVNYFDMVGHHYIKITDNQEVDIIRLAKMTNVKPTKALKDSPDLDKLKEIEETKITIDGLNSVSNYKQDRFYGTDVVVMNRLATVIKDSLSTREGLPVGVYDEVAEQMFTEKGKTQTFKPLKPEKSINQFYDGLPDLTLINPIDSTRSKVGKPKRVRGRVPKSESDFYLGMEKNEEGKMVIITRTKAKKAPKGIKNKGRVDKLYQRDFENRQNADAELDIKGGFDDMFGDEVLGFVKLTEKESIELAKKSAAMEKKSALKQAEACGLSKKGS